MKRPFIFYRKIFAYFIMKVLFIIAFVSASTGCGLKGPLYLPEDAEKIEENKEQSSKPSEPTKQQNENNTL